MEITGIIIELQDEKVISAKFRKRSMIIETSEDKYPQMIEIEFAQDRGQLLDKQSVGQKVEVGINIRGRKWLSPKGETRYFTSLDGWRIKAADTGGTTYPAPSSQQGGPPSDDDDIPF